MARTKKTETVVVTRAEKKDATKNLIKEALAESPLKHNELIESVAKTYTERFGSDTDNANDVKGRVGSVLDIMKKESEVAYDGGRYALKARLPMPAPAETVAQAPVEATEEKPKKKSVRKAKTVEKKDAEADSVAPLETVENAKEKPAKKTVKKTAKKADEKEKLIVTRLTPPTVSKEKEKQEEKEEPILPLPPAPLQPIAPVVPVSPEVAPEPMPEKTEKAKRETKKAKTAPVEAVAQAPAEATEEKPKKKSVRKTKTVEKKEAKKDGVAVLEKVEKSQEQPQAVVVLEEKQRAPQEEKEAEVKNSPVVRQKAEIAPKTEVMDMSFLFGAVKPAKVETKTETKPEVKTEEKPQTKPVQAATEQVEKPAENKPQSVSISEEKQTKNAPQKTLAQPQNGGQKQGQSRVLKTVKKAVQKPLTADEKLRESFLKKLRSLGGDYFEYYSVYLLEKYSRKNGRRLESLRICGGGRDGGIDGEIELTDKLGFRETIYIQSKNWDPDRGDERLWVVGETLLQQFIGACACKQAKDGKQNARGIFITTSNFTADAKRILDVLSDKVVGYDGNDLYEAAKECHFGLLYENGNWKLDEKLLSGVKAFFAM